MRKHKLQYYRDRKREWRWRWTSPNGHILSTSAGDGYKDRHKAVRGFTAMAEAIRNGKWKEVA